jgi:hypothetical protein
MNGGAWFKVGQHVLVNGAGVGRIIEVGDAHERYEGYRYYRVNFGKTECPTCRRPGKDRIQWAMAIHISLTVGEQKAAVGATPEQTT